MGLTVEHINKFGSSFVVSLCELGDGGENLN